MPSWCTTLTEWSGEASLASSLTPGAWSWPGSRGSGFDRTSSGSKAPATVHDHICIVYCCIVLYKLDREQARRRGESLGRPFLQRNCKNPTLARLKRKYGDERKRELSTTSKPKGPPSASIPLLFFLLLLVLPPSVSTDASRRTRHSKANSWRTLSRSSRGKVPPRLRFSILWSTCFSPAGMQLWLR